MSSSASSSAFHNINLKLCRHTWGVDESFDAFFSRYLSASSSASSSSSSSSLAFKCLEFGLIWTSSAQRDQLSRIFAAHKDVEWIAMIFTDTPLKPTKTVEEHIAEFERQVQEALKFHQPKAFNVHAGKDSWTLQEGVKYFNAVYALAAKWNIPVYHETHRGRILFSPWATKAYVEAVPQLLLTADLSHWVVVCERLIDTEIDILHSIAPRIRHIHARVGYENGPQVNDPRAEEWKEYVAAHERWWTIVLEAAWKEQRTEITVTPEYGPASYLHTLPYTRVPVAKLDEIVDWAAHRFVKFFEEWLAAKLASPKA